MHQPIRSAVFITLLSITSAALAAETGFYVGAGVGQTDANLTGEIHKPLVDEGFSVLGLSLNDTDTGWKLFSGYVLNPYLAAELSYVDLGQTGAEITIGGGAPGRINTTMDMSGVNLGLKLNYPFDEDFLAFAKLGAFIWNAEATARADLSTGSGSSNQKDNGVDFSYGLGISYAFTDHVSLRGDWDYYRLGGNADADVNLWSVSVQYLF